MESAASGSGCMDNSPEASRGFSDCWGQAEGPLLTFSPLAMGFAMEDAPLEWEADALLCARALRDAADPEWAALAAQVWNSIHCDKFNAPYTCSGSVMALEAITERLAKRKVRPMGWAREVPIWEGLMNLAYFGQQEGGRGKPDKDGAYRARLCIARLDREAVHAVHETLDATEEARDEGAAKVLLSAATFLFEVSLTPTLHPELIACGVLDLGKRVLSRPAQAHGGNSHKLHATHEAILALACLNVVSAMEVEDVPQTEISSLLKDVDMESVLVEVTRAHVKEIKCMGYSWSDEEVCMSLVSAATDEQRSTSIGRKVVPLLLEAIASRDDFSKITSNGTSSDDAVGWYCMALWQLAFSSENAKMIWASTGVVNVIKKEAAKEDDEDANYFIEQQAGGLLLTVKTVLGISNENGQGSRNLQEEGEPKEGTHVMISYCWAQKPVATEIARCLRAEGIPYWIDQEKMEGDTLATMAHAVEEAKCVVLLMSRNYMASHNCHLEASYANALKKELQPVIVEKDYKPTGWLGILLGNKMYVRMSTPEEVRGPNMANLLGKLRPLFRESELADKVPLADVSAESGDLESGLPRAPSMMLQRAVSANMDDFRAKRFGLKWRAKAKSRSAHSLTSLFAGVRENEHAEEDNCMLDAFFSTSRLLEINNTGRKDNWDEESVSDDEDNEKLNSAEGRSALVSCVKYIYSTSASCLKFVLHGGAEEDTEAGGEVDRAEAGLKVKPKRRYESCRGLLFFSIVFSAISMSTWYNVVDSKIGAAFMFVVSLWPMAMLAYTRVLDPGQFRAALLGNLKDAHVRIISYLSIIVSLNAGLLPFLDGNSAYDPFFCFSTMDMSAEPTYQQDLTDRSDDVYFGTCRWTTYLCAAGGTCPAGYWDKYTTPSCSHHQLARDRINAWNSTEYAGAPQPPANWDWCPTFPRRWYYQWKFSTVMVLMWLVALISVAISIYFQPSPWTLRKLRKRLGDAELRKGNFCHSIEFASQILVRRILRTEFLFSWWIGPLVGSGVALYTVFGTQDPHQFKDTPWPFWLCFAAYIFSVVFSCLLYHTYCFKRSDILLRGIVVRFELLTAAISAIFDQQNVDDSEMAELDDVGLGQLVSEEIAEIVENHVHLDGFPTQRLQQWLAYRSVVVAELIPVIEYCSSFGLAAVTLPALLCTGITLYNVTVYGVEIIITGQLAMLEFIVAVVCSLYTLKMLSTACAIYTVQDTFAGMIQDEMLQEAIYVGNYNYSHTSPSQGQRHATPGQESHETTPLHERSVQLRDLYYGYLSQNKFFVRLFGIPVKPILFIILRLYFASAACYIIVIGIAGYTAD